VKKLKGRITMGRWSGTSEGFRVTVEDVLSGCEVIEVEMTMAQFADAITGRGSVSCEFTLTPEQVGMKHEHKAVEVFVPDKVGKKKLDRVTFDRWVPADDQPPGLAGQGGAVE
jgi:hypothetical protein